MTPADLKEANIVFRHPEGWDNSQCGDIQAFVGEIGEGNLDGSTAIVVAWQPNEEDIIRITKGAPVYLMILDDGLPPHSMSTVFPLRK